MDVFSSGPRHVVWATDSGRVYAMGEGSKGQLGTGTTARETDPTVVLEEMGPVSSVACGDAHSMVLFSSGDLVSFGDSFEGQCGVAKRTEVMVPQRVTSE